MKALKVGVVQMTSTENIQENVNAVMASLEKLRSHHCDLICLPENALYLRIDKSKTVPSFNLKETFWAQFQEFSNRENCVVVLGSIAYAKGKKKYNATVVIEPKRKPRVVYEKIHLFDVDVVGAPPSRESDEFDHGRGPKIIKVKGWQIGLSICYDVRFSELYKYYAKKQVQLILVPAAFLVPTGRAHWHVLMRARAIETQAFLVAAAQCGVHTNAQNMKRDTFGHSLVVGPWGDVIIDLGGEGTAVHCELLSFEPIEHVRRQIPMAKHRRLR